MDGTALEDYLVTVIIVVILLAFSGFFSGSETALTATSRSLMRDMERQGSARARMVNTLLAHRERLIGTILLGNNLVNIMASALATSVMIAVFGEAGVVYATAAMTVLVLIFAEILPKTLALIHTERVALFVAPLMRPVVWLFAPLTAAIQGLVRVILGVFGAHERASRSAEETLAELRGAIELHAEETPQNVADERNMLRSVLDLSDVEVGEIMIHRNKLLTIDADLPMGEIVEQVATSPFTRLPIWQGEPDQIIGVIHAKALLRAVHGAGGDPEKVVLRDLLTPPWFIPESTSLLGQLNAFRERREHFALVVDEYGALQGVVTLEDILEEIVGEIADEHDVIFSGVRPAADGGYLVEGTVTLRDLNRQFDWSLPDEEASTIAGLVLHESRSIPQAGQVYQFHGYRFEVMRRHRNQITLIKVLPPEPENTLDALSDTVPVHGA